MIRIFRGIFYVKSLDEIKLGKNKYSHIDLVAKGLALKSVKNWYFGLYTALKLNNMKHEHFTIDYVVNDKILRIKPITIAGYKFKFVKLKSALFSFGIIGKNLKYSDPKKQSWTSFTYGATTVSQKKRYPQTLGNGPYTYQNPS